MIYAWTDEMVSFMEDASENSDYFFKLSNVITPYLAGLRTVCDAGCGLGGLAKKLAQRGFSAFACDISENAIQYIKNENWKNVTPVCCDLQKWTPAEKFDAMIFNYFGSLSEVLDISSRCCKGVIIIIKKNYRFHRFSFEKNPIQQRADESAESFFEKHNISYEKKEIEFEFGQPFRSIEDAVKFFEIYSRDTNKSIISPENVRKKLVSSAIPGFKYYLPQKKSSLLFVIRSEK